MLSIGVFLLYLFYSVNGDGQLIILEAPNTLEFSGSDVIDADDVPNVFSASLGFTVHESSSWPGLEIKHPFGFPEILVVVAVEGISTLGDFGKLPAYPISSSQDEEQTWEIIQNEVFERYPKLNATKSFERIVLGGEENDVSDIPVTYLNNENMEDKYFLSTLVEFKSFINKYKHNELTFDGIPRINWFVLNSLHVLSDVESSDKAAVSEAKELIRETLMKLGSILRKAAKGRALVAAVVSDGAHTRRERDVTTTNATEKEAPTNRAPIYSDDYPAIFNIILWFTVAFVFSLIAIAYAIATMDPGRDSIIYRMTSNRIKKDS